MDAATSQCSEETTLKTSAQYETNAPSEIRKPQNTPNIPTSKNVTPSGGKRNQCTGIQPSAMFTVTVVTTVTFLLIAYPPF